MVARTDDRTRDSLTFPRGSFRYEVRWASTARGELELIDDRTDVAIMHSAKVNIYWYYSPMVSYDDPYAKHFVA